VDGRDRQAEATPFFERLTADESPSFVQNCRLAILDDSIALACDIRC